MQLLQSIHMVKCLLLMLPIIVFKYLTQTCRTHTCLVVLVVRAPGQFSYLPGVDWNNHHVQLFSADAWTVYLIIWQQGVSAWSTMQCVDSTNTVHH